MPTVGIDRFDDSLECRVSGSVRFDDVYSESIWNVIGCYERDVHVCFGSEFLRAVSGRVYRVA